MLDRASTFAHPEIVELLKTRFIPVALDQASTRRQQDTEGQFYRRLVLQHPGFRLTNKDVKAAINSTTTQGFYIATAAGDLLLYNNNRHPEKVLRLMKEKLASLETKESVAVNPLTENETDKRYDIRPPSGGLVMRVQAKVLGGYAETSDPWKTIFQSALSRDNLWVTPQEHQALVDGTVPQSLQLRIARFHLVDNTRGEPLMWKPDEVRRSKLKIVDGEITGSVLIHSESNDRGYETQLRGRLEVYNGKITRFAMVALGDCWGEGPYTKNPPKGKFPLGISFTLADGSDAADSLPPQAARGWVDGYIRMRAE
ncbi:MAG: hypothetical protein WBD20_24175 [Pirellulaceae bacterium]